MDTSSESFPAHGEVLNPWETPRLESVEIRLEEMLMGY